MIILTSLGVVFALLGLLHLSWAAGIKWGFDASLPTNKEGERVLNPKPIDCLVVGIGLALFSAYYFTKSQQLQLTPSDTIDSIISWVIPSIFLLRSVGDFKYVGFFKKVKDTSFGRLDTQVIIPLCMLIALLGFWAA